MSDIVLTDLCKRFGEKRVLDHFSAQIPEGKITCVMGSSGSGKTTLLYLLMGLLQPDQGRIRGLEGKGLAVSFQEDRLCEALSAIENVKLVCSRETSEESIRKELVCVGLGDSLEQPVSSLSGGMRRRVSLIRALMAMSDVVLLDEPFKGMDENLHKLLIGYIKEKIRGKTAVIVTHDKKEIDLLDANLILIPSLSVGNQDKKENGKFVKKI